VTPYAEERDPSLSKKEVQQERTPGEEKREVNPSFYQRTPEKSLRKGNGAKHEKNPRSKPLSSQKGKLILKDLRRGIAGGKHRVGRALGRKERRPAGRKERGPAPARPEKKGKKSRTSGVLFI